MTEAEWRASDAPGAMLKFLEGRISERKLQLFGIECCRITRRNRGTEQGANLECVERLADGTGDLAEVRRHWSLKRQRARRTYPERPLEWCSTYIAKAPRPGQRSGQGFPTTTELASLFREVAGNPFRPVAFASEWRTDTAVTLARQMYDARDFSAMPILADALQDAGCDEAAVLDHCRGEGRMFAGVGSWIWCWARSSNEASRAGVPPGPLAFPRRLLPPFRWARKAHGGWGEEVRG